METIDAKNKDMKAVNKTLKTILNGQPVVVKNAEHLHGLASGLKSGEVIIRGNAGDYLGVLNNGATIKVTKNAGKYIADNMTLGVVIIDGSADYGAGQYCYGGSIIIYGDAGDFTATMNKGATILVAGDVGDEAGTYMLNGDLIVLGNAGENFSNYMIHGNVYIGGNWRSLGHNTCVEQLTNRDLVKLSSFFEEHGIEADLTNFKKIVAASEKPFYR
jgi:glutamate synthase domain-containing protein 3